jgi:hypothetical protein
MNSRRDEYAMLHNGADANLFAAIKASASLRAWDSVFFQTLDIMPSVELLDTPLEDTVEEAQDD